MLVKSQPGGRPPAAERQVAEQFASWIGKDAVPGLLLTNVHVPHDAEGSRLVGAMVFTPTALTVLEVHGLTQRQTGTLHCPPDAAWTVGGAPALLATQAHANPAQNLDTNVYATHTALTHRDVEPGAIGGLVVIIPMETGDLRLGRGGARARGYSVVVAAHRDLRRHFTGRRRQFWTADKVVAACEALGMGGYAPTVEELCEDGFAPGTAARAVAAAPTLRTPRAAATVGTTTSGHTAAPMDFEGEAPTPPRGIPLFDLTAETAVTVGPSAGLTDTATDAAPIDLTPAELPPPGETTWPDTPAGGTAVLPAVPAEIAPAEYVPEYPPDEIPVESYAPADLDIDEEEPPSAPLSEPAPEPLPGPAPPVAPVRGRRPVQARLVIPVVLAVAVTFVVAVLLVELLRSVFH